MMRLDFLLFLTLAGLAGGCATAPRPVADRPRPALVAADAFITQRGVLTVLGRQVTLTGYVSQSAARGWRLVLTENFGGVLADLLVKPDGRVTVLKARPPFRAAWVERYVAADLLAVFTGAPDDGAVQRLSATHYSIQRRWYRLDLRTVEVKPGPQPAKLFDATPGTGS